MKYLEIIIRPERYTATKEALAAGRFYSAITFDVLGRGKKRAIMRYMMPQRVRKNSSPSRFCARSSSASMRWTKRWRRSSPS